MITRITIFVILALSLATYASSPAAKRPFTRTATLRAATEIRSSSNHPEWFKRES